MEIVLADIYANHCGIALLPLPALRAFDPRSYISAKDIAASAMRPCSSFRPNGADVRHFEHGLFRWPETTRWAFSYGKELTLPHFPNVLTNR